MKYQPVHSDCICALTALKNNSIQLWLKQVPECFKRHSVNNEFLRSCTLQSPKEFEARLCIDICVTKTRKLKKWTLRVTEQRVQALTGKCLCFSALGSQDPGVRICCHHLSRALCRAAERDTERRSHACPWEFPWSWPHVPYKGIEHLRLLKGQQQGH